MKKTILLVLTLSFLMLMSVTASAHDWHNNSPYDHDGNWHRTHQNDSEPERGLPFAWHEHYKSMSKHYHLERIEDREWAHRFPGLHAYRWSGHNGFWHQGHYVKDAVLFFDEHNELVSVGYIADGVFIQFRDDHESYENHDSFFISWLHR